MNADPGSLENLRDLAVPAPVAFWPPGPGAWIVLTGLAAMLALLLRDLRRRHRANAYRRAALAELDATAASPRPDARSIERVSEVMKRAALVAFPREQVARLSGANWADFLAGSGGGKLDAPAMRRLLSQAYGAHGPEPAEVRRLIEQARIWVAQHRSTGKAGAG
ncbi:DUF4381 domain-containing protein [Methylobacterium sp. WSM2598]|uniref:DUF4381 domain-containing protein n=1 Tax=Methylobacterium sp. WSM2598 TaxID=398261 RepID=UPI00036542D4|nr:DUF4381 domain-containing protein [Methylobacterium sp. WSM2598]